MCFFFSSVAGGIPFVRDVEGRGDGGSLGVGCGVYLPLWCPQCCIDVCESEMYIFQDAFVLYLWFLEL